MAKLRFLISVALLALGAMNTGCATIFHGTTQKIMVKSSPQEAEVRIDGKSMGRTPLEVELKRNKSYVLTLEKNGYPTQKVPVERVMSGLVWLNVMNYFIGGAIDAISGGSGQLYPESVDVEFAGAPNDQESAPVYSNKGHGRPAPDNESVAAEGVPSLSLEAKVESSPGSSGVYEPGDSLVLAVKVKNTGKAISKGPKVMMRGDGIMLHYFSDTDGSMADIRPGDSRTYRFKSKLPSGLPSRQSELTFKVQDQDGFMAELGAPLLVATQPKAVVASNGLPLLVPVPDSNVGGRPHGAALVVGISKYSSADAGELRFAASDADMMGKYLVNMMGIPQEHVWVIKDEQATRSRILATLQGKIAGKGYDPVVVYFSSHGIPNPEDPTSGDSCIVPYDGDFQKGFSGTLINLNELTKMVEGSTKGQSMIMLDACFSGSHSGRAPVLLAGQRGVAIKPRIKAARATILTGSSGTQPSLDFDDQQHGYFTYFMLAGLQGKADLNGDGKVTLTEAFNWTQERVSKGTDGRQVPELKNSAEIVMSKWR